MSSRLRTLSRARCRSKLTKTRFQQEETITVNDNEDDSNENIVFIHTRQVYRSDSEYSDDSTKIVPASASSSGDDSVMYNISPPSTVDMTASIGVGYTNLSDRLQLNTKRSDVTNHSPDVVGVTAAASSQAPAADNVDLSKIITAPLKVANVVTRVGDFVDAVAEGDLLSEPVLIMGAAGIATAAAVGGVAMKKMRRSKKSTHEQQLTLQRARRRPAERVDDQQLEAHAMQERINQRLADSRRSLLQYVENRGLEDTIPEPFTSLRTDIETGQMYDPVSGSLYDMENDVFIDPETGLVWDLNCQPPCLFQWESGMTITDMVMQNISIPEANLWQPPPYFKDAAFQTNDETILDDRKIERKQSISDLYIGQAREQLTDLHAEVRIQEDKSKKHAKYYKRIDWGWFIVIILIGGTITLMEITRERSNPFAIILSVLLVLLKAGHMAAKPSSRSTRYKDAETQFGKVCDEINEARSVLRTSRDIISYITAVKGQVREIKRVVFNEGNFDVSAGRRPDDDLDIV